MKDSTQIFRPMNVVHLANQTDGILHSPPIPTQGGSSTSKLVLTTSLRQKIRGSRAPSLHSRVPFGQNQHFFSVQAPVPMGPDHWGKKMWDKG